MLSLYLNIIPKAGDILARVDFRISDEAKKEAERQADSIGLDLSEYTRMLYKLDLSKLVKKSIEKEERK